MTATGTPWGRRLLNIGLGFALTLRGLPSHASHVRGVRVDPDIHWLPSAMTEFAITGGVDHRGHGPQGRPGLFAQEGRCWRMIYENVAGHAGHCPDPVAWVGRWEFQKGWTKLSVVRTPRRRVAVG